jgi:hypothetical protein
VEMCPRLPAVRSPLEGPAGVGRAIRSPSHRYHKASSRTTSPRARDRRGLLKPGANAMIQEAQEGAILGKQPNSRMCLVCGIENPIGLKLRFYTDGEGRCIARFRPSQEHQGFPGQLHGGLIDTLAVEPHCGQ